MPRIVKGLGDSLIYHVLNRGNGRQEVFHKDRDYAVFINLMKEAKERYSVKIFNYSGDVIKNTNYTNGRMSQILNSWNYEVAET